MSDAELTPMKSPVEHVIHTDLSSSCSHASSPDAIIHVRPVVKETTGKMKKAGQIRDCPRSLVISNNNKKKKSGECRVCLEYRKLNAITIQLNQQDAQKTAFRMPGNGHCTMFNVLPLACRIARPTTFEKSMDTTTSFILEKEQYHQTKWELLAALDSAMGGRAAEELIYGTLKVTTGVASDLKKATDIAALMVKQAGMSEKVGLRTFDGRRNELGIIMDELSPNTTEAIDIEIRRLLQGSYERAKTILKAHAVAHKRLAEALLQNETLEFKEIKAIIDGESIVKS